MAVVVLSRILGVGRSADGRSTGKWLTHAEFVFWLLSTVRLTLATMCCLSHFQKSAVLLGLSYAGCCQVDTTGTFITMYGTSAVAVLVMHCPGGTLRPFDGRGRYPEWLVSVFQVLCFAVPLLHTSVR